MFSEIKIILDNKIINNFIRRDRRFICCGNYDDDEEQMEYHKYGKVEINGLINNGFVLLWMSEKDFRTNKRVLFFGNRFNYFNADDFKIWIKHINSEIYATIEDKETRYNMNKSERVIYNNSIYNNNLILDEILTLIINSGSKEKIVYSKPKNEYEKIFYAYAGALPFNTKDLIVSKNQNKLYNYYFLNNEGVYNKELLDLLKSQKTPKDKEILAFEYIKNSNNSEILNEASKIKNKFSDSEVKELCFCNFDLNKEVWNNMMRSNINLFANYSGFNSVNLTENSYIYNDDGELVSKVSDEIIKNTFLTKKGAYIKSKILDFINSCSSEIKNKRFEMFPDLWKIYQVAIENK